MRRRSVASQLGFVVAGCSMLALLGPVAEAADAQVDAGGGRFTPADLTVKVGESVSWRILEGVHTVTAADGSFDSQDKVVGDVFVVRFERAGRFAYACRYDAEIGMTGVIQVGGAAPEPVPTTTAPPPPPAAAAASQAAPPAPSTATTAKAQTSTTTTTTMPPVPIEAWLGPAPTSPPPPEIPPPSEPLLTDENAVTAILEEDDDQAVGAGLLIAGGVAGAGLLGAGAYAWWRRPSRYLPA